MTAPADKEGAIIGMMRALHSHLPEDKQPIARMDFSDEQWARCEAAYDAAQAPAEKQPSPVLVGERLKAAHKRLYALTKAGEDFIWRPADAACSAIDDAIALIERLEGEKATAEHYSRVNYDDATRLTGLLETAEETLDSVRTAYRYQLDQDWQARAEAAEAKLSALASPEPGDDGPPKPMKYDV